MKKWRGIIVSALIIIFLAVGFALLFRSLDKPPYKVYPNTFQQRGMQDAIDGYAPKSRADSLFALEMLILQKSSQQEYNYKEGSPDIIKLLGGILSILVAIGAIGKLLYDFVNSKSDKRHEEIMGSFAENAEQHVELFDGIRSANDAKYRRVVIDVLTHIAADHLFHKRRYITADLRDLIKSQAQRLIELSSQIMDEKFTPEMLEYAFVCIEAKNKEAWHQVSELFGCDFLLYYKDGQGKSVTEFKKNLTKLAESNIINSKYDRYRAYAELFLHDIIENTLLQHEKYMESQVVMK